MSEKITGTLKAVEEIPHNKLILWLSIIMLAVSSAVLMGVYTDALQVNEHSRLAPYFVFTAGSILLVYSVILRADYFNKTQDYNLEMERAKAETAKAELHLARERNK